jgi:hypothetical protein
MGMESINTNSTGKPLSGFLVLYFYRCMYAVNNKNTLFNKKRDNEICTASFYLEELYDIIFMIKHKSEV